jgi:alpha-glucosidase
VYYYPNDPNVRTMGDEKLLGRDLLVAAVASFGSQVGSPNEERCVYLPAGDWIDVHTDQRYRSEGAWFGPFPTVVEPPEEMPEGAMAQTAGDAPETRFRLPMFARAGAIVPRMHVDDRTMNAFGRRTDGSRRDELIVQVYADETASAFTLFEDDGRTMAYQRGELRTTTLSQVQTEDGVRVTIEGASGDYEGAPSSRDNVVHLITERAGDVGEVTLAVAPLGPASLARHETLEAFNAASSGWVLAGPNRIVAKSGEMHVTMSKMFHFSYRSPDVEAFSPEERVYLPLVLDGEGPEALPCYAYRACCEKDIRCEERVYLPLMLRMPGAPVDGG